MDTTTQAPLIGKVVRHRSFCDCCRDDTTRTDKRAAKRAQRHRERAALRATDTTED